MKSIVGIPSHLQSIATELKELLTGKTGSLEDFFKTEKENAYFLLRQGGILAIERDKSLPVLERGAEAASVRVYDLKGRPLGAFQKAWGAPWHLFLMTMPEFLQNNLPVLSAPPRMLQRR